LKSGGRDCTSQCEAGSAITVVRKVWCPRGVGDLTHKGHLPVLDVVEDMHHSTPLHIKRGYIRWQNRPPQRETIRQKGFVSFNTPNGRVGHDECDRHDAVCAKESDGKGSRTDLSMKRVNASNREYESEMKRAHKAPDRAAAA